MGGCQVSDAGADRARVADGAEAVCRSHPGTTQLPHLRENRKAADIRFDAAELGAFNAELAQIPVEGPRLSAAALKLTDL